MRRTRAQARYTLMIGDLGIDQVLCIRDAVMKSSEVSHSLKTRVESAIQVVWDAYDAAETSQRIWHEWVDFKFGDLKKFKGLVGR